MDLGAPLGAPIGSHGAGQNASGDVPRGTPIADKFSNSNTSDSYGQSGEGGRGLGGETVSGAYSGGSTGDALTGQSGHSTGAGVGPLAENLRGSSGATGEHHHHHHHHHEGAGAVAGGAGIAGSREYEEAYGHSGSSAATSAAPLTRGEGVAGLGKGLQPGVGGDNGTTGIGPNSSEGEAYTNSRREPGYGNLGPGAGAAAGVGAGVGAGELYESRSGRGGQDDYSSSTGASGGAGSKIAQGGLSESGPNGLNEPGTGGGKYGRAEQDSTSGEPLTNPKDMDTGNSHSLIFDEASGKYVHRRDIEGPNHGSRA